MIIDILYKCIIGMGAGLVGVLIVWVITELMLLCGKLGGFIFELKKKFKNRKD